MFHGFSSRNDHVDEDRKNRGAEFLRALDQHRRRGMQHDGRPGNICFREKQDSARERLGQLCCDQLQCAVEPVFSDLVSPVKPRLSSLGRPTIRVPVRRFPTLFHEGRL